MGLKYEYSVRKTKETGNEIMEPLYRWRYGAWTDCSTTCGLGLSSFIFKKSLKINCLYWQSLIGVQFCFRHIYCITNSVFTGEQHQPVRCFETDVGVVDELLCDPESRPEDRHRKCKIMDCPARFLISNVPKMLCHNCIYVGVHTFQK